MVRFSPAMLLRCVLAGLALGPAAALGFDGNKATQRPLQLTIEPIEVVTELDASRDLTVTLANQGKSDLDADLQISGLVDECRYRLGTLVLEGNKQKLTGVHLEPGPGEPALAKRLCPNPKPTSFGPIQTSGALRCVVRPDRLVLTPLPDEAPFQVELDLAKLLGRAAEVTGIAAVDAKGTKLRDVKCAFSAGRLSLTTGKDEFAYEIMVRH